MAEKSTQLSIVIRTVDQATAKIKAINARLDAATKPVRDFKEALGDLREKSGLDDVISGFKGVGSAIGDLLSKVALIGGIAGVAVAGLFSLVDGFDDLGDKAQALGVNVDFLAQMRYAAERSGVAVEELDSSLQGFSSSLGMARAGTGKMAGFLKLVSPELLKQLKATKSNEEAFGLLADAMKKIKDPAKQAAFAQKTLGNASLAPMLAQGSKGIKALRDRYAELAGSQEGAVTEAGKVDDSMKDLKASTDGIKAALVQGLSPALKIIIDQLSEWFTAHREDIAEWAKDIGEKLPGAIQEIVKWLEKAWETVTSFIDKIGGLKNAAIVAAAIMAGPLIGSVVSLTGALFTAVGRAGQLGKALAGIGPAAGGAGGLVGVLGPLGLAIGAASVLNDLTGGSIGEGEGGAMGIARKELERRIRSEHPGALPAPTRDVSAQATDASAPDVSDQASSLVDDRSFVDARAGVGAQIAAALAAQNAAHPAQAKVTIELANAPRGTRVRTDPQSTADVDLSVGYQMGFAP